MRYLIVILGCFFLASCSSGKFTQRRYLKGHYFCHSTELPPLKEAKSDKRTGNVQPKKQARNEKDTLFTEIQTRSSEDITTETIGNKKSLKNNFVSRLKRKIRPAADSKKDQQPDPDPKKNKGSKNIKAIIGLILDYLGICCILVGMAILFNVGFIAWFYVLVAAGFACGLISLLLGLSNLRKIKSQKSGKGVKRTLSIIAIALGALVMVLSVIYPVLFVVLEAMITVLP